MNKQEKEKQLDVAKECLLDELKEADTITEDLLLAYDTAAERLKTEIERALMRFAEDNVISLAEAKKLLKGKEFTVWKKSIEKYLQEIKDEGADTKMLLELNTLSAKTSISRKEQLLAQIDMEMSSLHPTHAGILQSIWNSAGKQLLSWILSVQKTVGFGFNVGRFNPRTDQIRTGISMVDKTFFKNHMG